VAAARRPKEVIVKRVQAGAVILLALAVRSPSISAHHSTTAEFDVVHRMTLTGTLTKVDWVNPHIVVFMNVKGDTGTAEAWKFESNPPAWFRRVGVSRADFAKAIGQTITVEGNRAKDGSLYGYLVKVTFADGSSLELVPPGGAAP
jgi:hypothetical protein